MNFIIQSGGANAKATRKVEIALEEGALYSYFYILEGKIERTHLYYVSIRSPKKYRKNNDGQRNDKTHTLAYNQGMYESVILLGLT